MANERATDAEANDVPKRPVPRCSRGHMRSKHHITTVLLNLKTTSADYADAAAAGYCAERRWSGDERRRS